MDRSYLVKTAKQIKDAEDFAYEEYSIKIDGLVAQVNIRLLKREDIQGLVGGANIEMMKDNHANHARFINSILRAPNPEVLVETVLWVFRAYRSHGFHTNYWAAQLNAWIETLQGELSPESFREIYPLYEWMQINIPMFARLSAEMPIDEEPRH